MPQERLACKLKKEGEIIDENCECTLHLERRNAISTFLQGGGELWTSKPLPVTAMFLLDHTPFILVFEPSVLFIHTGKSDEVPITLQKIFDWKTKRHARFIVE